MPLAPIRSRLARLSLAALAVLLLSARAGAALSAVDPTPLGAAASASPQLQLPAGEPQPLVVAPPAAGATGPATARGEGKVAAAKPVAFVFRATADGMVSIGVSSPGNAARISVFLGSSTEPIGGTKVEDGAIRWSSGLAAGEAAKIVVHTTGPEIPFRVEVTVGPGSI